MKQEEPLFSRASFLSPPLVALSLGRFFQSTGSSIFMPILPVYLTTLPDPWMDGLSRELKVGILVSLFGLAMTLTQGPVARLSDKWGRRKTLLLAAIFLFSLLSLMFGQVATFSQLLFLRTLQGVCIGAALPLLMALVAAFSWQEHRGKAMGFFGTFHLMGFILGPLLGGALADYLGVTTTFVGASVFGFLCLLILSVFVPEPRQKCSRTRPKEERRDFSWKNHYLLALGLFALMSGITVIIPLFPFYRTHYGATYSQLSWIFTAIVVSRILTQMPVGYLADYLSKRSLILVGLACFSVSTVALAQAESVQVLIWLRFLQGISATFVLTPTMAFGANLAPSGLQGQAMGILGTGFTAGTTFGPIFAGFVASHTHTLPFWGAGGLAVAVAFLLFFCLEEEKKRE